MAITKQTLDRLVDLRADGMSLANIAKELGIARNTAVSYDKELREKISAVKAIKDEEMLERFRMTKQKRLEMLGERLQTIQEELSRRGLADISTSK